MGKILTNACLEPKDFLFFSWGPTAPFEARVFPECVFGSGRIISPKQEGLRGWGRGQTSWGRLAGVPWEMWQQGRRDQNNTQNTGEKGVGSALRGLSCPRVCSEPEM